MQFYTRPNVPDIELEKPIRAVIIDDNTSNRALTAALLKQFFSKHIVVVGEAYNVMQGEELVRRERPDFLLLDIDLHGRTCFEMLDMLKDIRSTFTVTLISTYEKYIRTGIEYGIASFIDKPFVQSDFIRGVVLGIKNVQEREELKNRLTREIKAELQDNLIGQGVPERRLQNDNNNSLSSAKQSISKFINISLKKRDGSQEIIPSTDIWYLSAEGSYTKIHCKGQIVYVDSKPLKRYEELLSENGFLRISRALLVNPMYCKILKVGTMDVSISLPDGNEVYVDRKYKNVIMEQI